MALGTLALLAISVGLSSAHQGSRANRVGVRLRRDKPTVFLGFGRLVDSGVDLSATARQELLIELHNNTRWSLYYDVPLGEHKPGEELVIYTIEDIRGKPVFVESLGDQFYLQSLQSGKSVVFRVPRERLMKGCRIVVRFNYEWEARGSARLLAGEPVHRAHFYYDDLPAHLR